MNEIVTPVVRGMAAEGMPFRGFLYAGLMLTADGPKVIEFNVRFGDPEAQVVLPLIDAPLVPLLAGAANGDLRGGRCTRADARAVGVVIASRGYPDSVHSGATITGVEEAEAIDDVAVYHAGTARRGGALVTNGGRVLTVVGRGATFETAIERAYAGVARIRFDGMQYRRDIGRKALGVYTTKDPTDTKG
jgi:phosphoribosylamine--glycine ligase